MMKTAILMFGCLAAAVAMADRQVRLNELDLSKAECGWGAIRAGKSVEGRALSVGGKAFAHGVGTHAISSAIFDVGGKALSFSAEVGVDDESGKGRGSVKFVVYADDRIAAESPVLRGGDAPHRLTADLAGAKRVELFVCDALDSTEFDHADWGEAVFTVRDDCVFRPFADDSQSGILTPKPSPAPRLNGARVYGVRPGHPVLWRVAASGARPMRFSVSKLPRGLAFDAVTGIFTGSIAARGDHDVTVRAENAAGRAERTLTFRVGDRIALTPPMGWNSWNCFAHTVTERNIRDAADALVASGLADHGWQYVNIDDFWQNKPGETKDATLIGPDRNADGSIAVNRRFSNMRALADAVHAKGLKIGLYSSPGPLTCGGCVGSWGHEWQDAKTYADWGFDYLKYDWCSYDRTAVGGGLEKHMLPYMLMGEALRAQDRDIVLSLCQYGMSSVSTWGGLCGQCWRTTGDIRDSWSSLSGILRQQESLWPFAGPGRWNDPDMLVVGRLGWGSLHPSHLTPNEQYTHLSMWAMLAAPLLIGCDLTALDDFTLALLTNDEVIEVNQDELGAQAAPVQGSAAEGEVWAKPMSDGSFALALVNPSPRRLTVSADLARLGFTGEWRARDLWRQRDEGLCTKAYAAELPRHATKLVRLFPRSGAKLKPCVGDVRNAAVYRRFEAKRPVGKPGYGGGEPCPDCPRKTAW